MSNIIFFKKKHRTRLVKIRCCLKKMNYREILFKCNMYITVSAVTIKFSFYFTFKIANQASLTLKRNTFQK